VVSRWRQYGEAGRGEASCIGNGHRQRWRGGGGAQGGAPRWECDRMGTGAALSASFAGVVGCHPSVSWVRTAAV